MTAAPDREETGSDPEETVGYGQDPDDDGTLLAVVGLACRFPGAGNAAEFWDNLAAGVETITEFPPVPGTDPGHVRACGVLADADRFDAGFFGYSPREALIMDPQHRVFLECAWEALEDAGYDPAGYGGAIGVFGGSSPSSYQARLYADRTLAFVDDYQIRLATGPDFLTTRVSYKLGLTGPAVTVQTACSTSLVAVHLAGQALLAGECDMALAGGVSAHVPAQPGQYTEGGILAADGHCRAFDADSGGTVGGDGVGIVVLKRLADARADGDTVRAVVRGSVINNDGLDKIGYTAPGVAGQARAVRAAHELAGVDPASITYVEAHGTGTRIGDPIEIAALTSAFREGTGRRGYCHVGSVKTNIGHTDAAAGVAGFIKTVLALQRGQIPASLHYRRPNPEIDFAASPFLVPTALTEWRSDGPRRAGVNSLGIGGTNAHVVLEEAPPAPESPPRRSHQLLVVSGRTPAALSAATARLAEHLRHHPGQELADVAWTLQAGRRAFPHRRIAVCTDREQAIGVLAGAAVPGSTGSAGASAPPGVVFMFPGQGSQRVGMGADLYRTQPAFRAAVDECAELAAPGLGFDLRDVLYPRDGDERAQAGATAHLATIAVGQPAVFVIEYATARLWRAWGVTPDAVVGHSLGAYAAACVAGVMSLPDALSLVIERGRMLQGLPTGAMLAVGLPESEVRELLDSAMSAGSGLVGPFDLAAINGPAQCVVSGPAAEIDALGTRLTGAGVDARRLHIATAGHSALVEPIIDRFEKYVGDLDLRPPRLTWISDRTGGPVTDAEATSPAYWAAHLRRTVRFADALATLMAGPARALVEVGPGNTLAGLARRHPDAPGHTVVHSLPHPADPTPGPEFMLTAAGRLWLTGIPIRWPGLHADERPRRVPLPAYPFERGRYLVEPPAGQWTPAEPTASRETLDEPADPDEPSDLDGPADADGPRTELERRIAAVFAQILGVGRIGLYDSFFDLGGDSLVATQLIRWLRQELGVALPIRAVFQAPTVETFAAAVAARLPAPPDPDPEPDDAPDPDPAPSPSRPALET